MDICLRKNRGKNDTHTQEEVPARLSHLRPRTVSQQTPNILLCQHSNLGAWIRTRVNRGTTSRPFPGLPVRTAPAPRACRPQGTRGWTSGATRHRMYPRLQREKDQERTRGKTWGHVTATSGVSLSCD